jgi:cyclophilin family peptidyl-prolyl cis-trans isomerase
MANNKFRTLSFKSFVTLILVTAMLTVFSIPLSAGDPVEKKPTEGTERVLMKTTLGEIVIELNAAKAPISVANFLAYVDDGYYDGTIFHRVMGNFMIQGGGFTVDMEQKKTLEPIKNEWENGLKNKRGSIAMARTSAPNSATSQFYINVVDNPSLDQPRGGAAYAVFGEVVEGMDVVDKIKVVKTGAKGLHRDVPVEPVIIEKVTRVKDKPKEEAPAEGKE